MTGPTPTTGRKTRPDPRPRDCIMNGSFLNPISIRKFVIVGVALCVATGVNPLAQEVETDKVQLVATGNGRAIVQVNGERMVLTEGETGPGEVMLVSADTEEATLEISGRTYVLRTDDVVAPILEEDYTPPPEDNGPVVLWADSSGSFYADGTVDGTPIKFLVDTGADLVTFSRTHAEELGLRYERGQPGFASTASGITPLMTLKVERIGIGHITLYDVPVSVILGGFPERPLLGSSALNQLDMNRSGNRMELTKR